MSEDFLEDSRNVNYKKHRNFHFYIEVPKLLSINLIQERRSEKINTFHVSWLIKYSEVYCRTFDYDNSQLRLLFELKLRPNL